jgi:hypothetical protein
VAEIKRNKPLPRSRRKDYTGDIRFAGIPSKDRRDEQKSRRDDNVKNIAVTLYDIDKAILYFFNNVIDPYVIEAGNKIKVPVIYGNPERWVASQKQGFMRDEKGKILTPVIMYKRSSINKDANIPVDNLNRNIVYTFQKKWSERNQYDNFSKLINKKPTKERELVAIPDYVVITYDIVMWTSYIEQMNKLIETVQFSEGRFWGEENSFQFSSKIDSFNQTVEVSTGEERVVKTNFTLDIKGYLVPESYKDLITTQKQYTTQQLILQDETEVDIASVFKTDERAEKVIVTTSKAKTTTGTLTDTLTSLIGQMYSASINYVNTYLDYIRTQKFYTTTGNANITGSLGGDSIVWFRNRETASAPAGLAPTSEDDFVFFVNGQLMEPDTYFINQIGIDFKLTISTGSLGFALDGADEVVGWGKFE